ncbi:hypothetical protein ACHAW6_007812 [Cyclotella cf. meneghiniana]
MFLHMDCPQTSSDLCHFIGCTNYYHDMWTVMSMFSNHFKIVSSWALALCRMVNKLHVTKNLAGAQNNFTTTKNEMLSMVVTLEEFRSMHLGSNIHVLTNHKK